MVEYVIYMVNYIRGGYFWPGGSDQAHNALRYMQVGHTSIGHIAMYPPARARYIVMWLQPLVTEER
jgi:hypothetical protein